MDSGKDKQDSGLAGKTTGTKGSTSQDQYKILDVNKEGDTIHSIVVELEDGRPLSLTVEGDLAKEDIKKGQMATLRTDGFYADDEALPKSAEVVKVSDAK